MMRPHTGDTPGSARFHGTGMADLVHDFRRIHMLMAMACHMPQTPEGIRRLDGFLRTAENTMKTPLGVGYLQALRAQPERVLEWLR